MLNYYKEKEQYNNLNDNQTSQINHLKHNNISNLTSSTTEYVDIDTNSTLTTEASTTTISITKTPIKCNANATIIDNKCVCNLGFVGDGVKYCDGKLLFKK